MLTISEAKHILEKTALDGNFEKHRKGNEWSDVIELISKLLDSNVENKFDKPQTILNDPLNDQTISLPEIINEIKDLLKNNFVEGPPFTIQRLSELLIDPNKYYVRTAVYKYLSALKTVLSVASISSDYPLVDMKAEIAKSKTDTSNANYGEPGVVMTKISWIVDAGVSEDGEEGIEVVKDLITEEVEVEVGKEVSEEVDGEEEKSKIGDHDVEEKKLASEEIEVTKEVPQESDRESSKVTTGEGRKRERDEEDVLQKNGKSTEIPSRSEARLKKSEVTIEDQMDV